MDPLTPVDVVKTVGEAADAKGGQDVKVDHVQFRHDRLEVVWPYEWVVETNVGDNCNNKIELSSFVQTPSMTW